MVVSMKGRMNLYKFVRPSIWIIPMFGKMILMCLQPILSPTTIGS